MLRDPGHSFVDGVDGRSRSDHGTTDHVNLQSELARSLDLGVGGAATGVFRQHALDAMLAKEGGIVLRSERTARGDDRCVRKAGRRCDRVNYADDVVMLRSRRKALPSELRPNAENIRCGASGSAAIAASMLACSSQSSSIALPHFGRSTASKETPVAAAAAIALLLICAANGCVASTTRAILSRVRYSARPETPPKPPVRTGRGLAAGLIVRPASDSVAAIAGRARQSLCETGRFARPPEQQDPQWSFVHRHHGASPMP